MRRKTYLEKQNCGKCLKYEISTLGAVAPKVLKKKIQKQYQKQYNDIAIRYDKIKHMKRFVDIIGGLIGLFILIAVTPFIAIAIFLEDGWPIFIQQRRVSKGKIINVYKFRSMVKNAEKLKKDLLNRNERSDGPFFKIRNDPRITKVGKFLRRTRLDEFPQFINVLKGDLSIVGPRPHEPEEIFLYPERYKKICLEKGGITCLSQINEKPFLPFEKEMELDAYYVENKSLWLDLKIIAKTIKVFLRKPDGI